MVWFADWAIEVGFSMKRGFRGGYEAVGEVDASVADRLHLFACLCELKLLC